MATWARSVSAWGPSRGSAGKAVAAIVEAREADGPFRSLYDFCERVDLGAVNRATIDALVCAGAFDCTGAMRKAMSDRLEDAMAAGQTAQRDRRQGQMSMFDAFDAPDDTTADVALPGDEWTEAEMLAREKGVLGFYITKHPLASHEQLLSACATAKAGDLARFEEGADVVLGGMVSSLRTVNARSGKRRTPASGSASLCSRI